MGSPVSYGAFPFMGAVPLSSFVGTVSYSPVVQRFHHIVLVNLLPTLTVCAALLWGTVACAQPIGPSQPVTLQHADKLAGRIDSSGGGNIVEATGNVTLLQGVVRIEADKATLYEARNSVVLVGNVRVTQPDFVMTAPRADYDGNTRIATSPNGVTITDRGAVLRAGFGEYNMYDRRARFRNGVVLNDQKSTLRANNGEYFSVERKAIFGGGVKVENDSGTITSRDLVYWRDSREAFATGNVVVVVVKNNARLAGDTVHHRPAEGYTVARGHPKVVKVDTVASGDSLGTVRRDTTIITAMKMEVFRGDYDEYVATDSVRLVRGDLQAIARRARFLPGDDIITLGPNLPRPRDTSAADSTHGKKDSAATPDAVAGVTPRSYGAAPVLWYGKSQLTGDSITVLSKQKKLRAIIVHRDAFAVTQGVPAARFDQLAAARLFFDVEGDTIRRVLAEEEASSIYYVNSSGKPSGVNRASGDTILITFKDGRASKIRIMGRKSRAEGEYFPEKLVRGQEGQFRLQGFRWYGRDGSLDALSAALPKAPVIQEVKPDAGTNLGTGTTPRPRTP